MYLFNELLVLTKLFTALPICQMFTAFLLMDSPNCQFSVAKPPMIQYSLPLSSTSKPSTLCLVTGLTYQEILATHNKYMLLMMIMK